MQNVLICAVAALVVASFFCGSAEAASSALNEDVYGKAIVGAVVLVGGLIILARLMGRA